MAVSPGGAQLVGGTITYNLPELKPAVTTAGQRVQVSTGNVNCEGGPDQPHYQRLATDPGQGMP